MQPGQFCADRFTALETELMSVTLRQASAIAVAATFLTAVFGAAGTYASAKVTHTGAGEAQAVPQFESQPVVQAVPEDQGDSSPASDVPAEAATSLANLVASQNQATGLPRELHCLAGAIYFEAKSESLAGQLAVGRVVIARSKSGRFPNSYCGVVYQPSQFSFVRGSSMPTIDQRSRQWRNAVAIAQIAHANSWRSPVEGALYFHAARVSPGWRLKRVARIDNHVFYR